MPIAHPPTPNIFVYTGNYVIQTQITYRPDMMLSNIYTPCDTGVHHGRLAYCFA
jgi:hypothetical protein